MVDLKEECSWLKEVNSQSLQSSLLNLGSSWPFDEENKTKRGYPQGFKKYQSPPHC